MPTFSDRQKLPDAAKPVVDLAERFGFKWSFDYEHAVPDWANQHLQIRTEEAYAPADMVARYRLGLVRGDKYPPATVSADDFLIDGATRYEAVKRNRGQTFPTVILADKYVGSSQPVRMRMHLLGTALNARNGKGVSKEDIRRAVEVIAEDNTYDATRVAALLGVTERMVLAFLSERKARERARRQGIDLNGSVPPSQLRMLGTTGLNDAPWKAVALLVSEAGMAPDDVRALLKNVREAGSDEAALQILDEEREARQEQIADYTFRGKAKPPVAGKVRQYLGFILKPDYLANPMLLTEHSPMLAQKHLEVLLQATEVLSQAAAHQQERLDAMATAATAAAGQG